MRQLTFIILLLFALRSISQPCNNITGNAKRIKFRINKNGIFSDTMLIKNNSVYISTKVIPGGDKKYYYLKFFDSGSVFISFMYCSLPKDSDLKDLYHGSYGKYKIENNKIQIETWGSYVGYYLQIGSINNNTILINKTAQRGRGRRYYNKQSCPDETFVFYKFDNSTRPFW